MCRKQKKNHKNYLPCQKMWKFHRVSNVILELTMSLELCMAKVNAESLY